VLTQSKNNVSALELKRQLGVSYRSAWLIKHKVMQAMRLAEDGRELDGRIEVDDAYLGGQFSGKAGRGSENKVPFVAAVQTTDDCRPLYACLSPQPPTLQAMAAFAASHIAPSATVVTDGLWCFAATTLVGAEHERIVTGGGKASMELPQFKRVNTLLGNLKTAITGTYHAFDFAKYAHIQRIRLHRGVPSGDAGLPVRRYAETREAAIGRTVRANRSRHEKSLLLPRPRLLDPDRAAPARRRRGQTDDTRHHRPSNLLTQLSRLAGAPYRLTAFLRRHRKLPLTNQ
jgi:hypothetical protein